MATLTQSCTICSTEFEPQFSYQMEERVDTDAAGRPRASFVFFCSQRCLERSHAGADGSVVCDACAARFSVELASQVVFTRGRRHYACGGECRAQLLAESGGARLGDGFAPPPAQAPAPARDAIPPVLDPARATTPPPPSTRRTRGARGNAPQVIAVFNHKGGTGKTTTAVTVAAGLAAQGRRVLLVDTDGQGNVAVSLGLTAERSLYHVLVMGLPVADAVVHALPDLDVVPSNETLAAAELYLAGRKNRDRVLATRLEAARELYDHIIVDCSPSLSLMNQNALVFADAVLCPVACDYLSLVGVRQVLRTIKHVNKLLVASGAAVGRVADAVRRARAHLPRGARHAPPALRRSLPAAGATRDQGEGGAGTGPHASRLRARLERGTGLSDGRRPSARRRTGRRARRRAVGRRCGVSDRDDFRSAAAKVLDPDEVEGVLSNTFYSAPPSAPRHAVPRRADKPTHYKVICISMYTDDLKRLDQMVDALKARGLTKANRSALIRYALDQVDLDSVPRGL